MSSAWKAKRFWKEATVTDQPGGYGIALDGRPVKTPAKTPLIVPTKGLALAIAAEWDAQQGEVKPETMPFTRMSNSALDKVTPQHAEVAALLAAYGESDLICYRAEGPEELALRQATAWDPLIKWAGTALAAPLLTGVGVMHVAQPGASVARLAEEVHKLDSFRLAAAHDLIALSGSLIIGLAVLKRHLDAETGWRLSRIDEDWQAELWGQDDEAVAMAATKSRDFSTAARFLDLVTSSAP